MYWLPKKPLAHDCADLEAGTVDCGDGRCVTAAEHCTGEEPDVALRSILRATVAELLVPRHRRVHHAHPRKGGLGKNKVWLFKVHTTSLFLDDQALTPFITG